MVQIFSHPPPMQNLLPLFLIFLLLPPTFSKSHLISNPHHFSTVTSNNSTNYTSIFQSNWIQAQCLALDSENETLTELWPSVMSQMSISASSFFYLGNYSLNQKLEYLSTFNYSSFLDPAVFSLVSWAEYVLSIVISLIAVFFCLFACQVFCIKKYRLFARCCMIDLNSNSGSWCEKCMLFTCIFISGVLMAFAVVLMVLNNDIFLGFFESKCFLSNLALEMYVPYPTDSAWLGTLSTVQKLSNASNILLQISEKSPQNLTNSTNITYALQSYDKILGEFEGNLSVYANRTLYNPNPLTNSQKTNISSTFLSNWGPSKVSGTYMNALRLELETRKLFLDLLQAALNATQVIISNSSDFSQVLTDRETDFDTLGQLSGEAFNELAQTLTSEDASVQKFFNGMLIVMAANFLPMVFGLLGFFAVAFCKWRVCNFCLHCAWICNCLMVGLMLTLLFFGFFYSGLMVWGCEIYNQALLDKSDFQSLSYELQLNANFSDTMQFCLFNESNSLANYYPFGSVLALTDRLYDSTTNLSNTSLATKSLEADLTKLKDYYQNYEYFPGKFSSSDENHPVAVMQELNLWSNYDSVGSYQTTYGLCQVTADEFVFNSDQCLYELEYQTGEDAKISLGQTLCISLNETTFTFAAERYTKATFNACSTKNVSSFHSVEDAIVQYFEALWTYKAETQALIMEMVIALESYKLKLSSLDSEISKIYNSSKSSFLGLKPLLEVTSNPETQGVSKMLNCSFMQEGLVKVGNSVCVTTIDGVFYLYITLMLFLLLQFALAVSSCLASIRMLPRDFDDAEGQVLIEKSPAGVELRRHSILY